MVLFILFKSDYNHLTKKKLSKAIIEIIKKVSLSFHLEFKFMDNYNNFNFINIVGRIFYIKKKTTKNYNELIIYKGFIKTREFINSKFYKNNYKLLTLLNFICFEKH